MNSMTQEARCNGKFIFSPDRPGLKKAHRAFDNAVILKVDNGITEYYSWWLNRKYGMVLSKPAWGTHITVVSDKDRVKDLNSFNLLKNRFNGKIVQVPHLVVVKKQWQFWVVDVKPTNEMIEVRKSLGLKENFPFHITIGRDDCVYS